LLDLPDALKDGLLSELITEGHARALQSISNQQSMIEAYKIIMKESGSVRRAEELARRFRDQDGEKRVEHRPQIMVSKEIDKWTSQLTEALGKNSQVKLRRSYRQTQVFITLKGSLNDTQSQLEKILSITEKDK
jgi:ParB-like chromosome segregation protein Spo0J